MTPSDSEFARLWSAVCDRSEQALALSQRGAEIATEQARRQTSRMREVVNELGATSPPVDQYILLNGLRFHFRDWGNLPGSARDGAAVLLLHGFTGHARGWDALARRLRSRHLVLALDQRGHGETEWASDYTVDRFVEDIDAFVGALDIAPVVLVGMSMGGRNAYHYAGTHPEAVAKLVLGDIGPEIAAAGRGRIGAMVQAPDVFDGPEDVVQAALATNPRAEEAALRERIVHNLMRLDDGRWTYRYDRLLRSATALPRPDPEIGWALLPKISSPTLLVRGAESDILAPETAARIVATMPDCRLVEVPDSGHPMQTDNPDAFYSAVEGFLG